MTEDASPENLRKFLDSDDPALVVMGLSMAKSMEISRDLIGLLGGLYLWHKNTAIRRAAKSAFAKHVPENAKKIMDWLKYSNYRNLSRVPRTWIPARYLKKNQYHTTYSENQCIKYTRLIEKGGICSSTNQVFGHFCYNCGTENKKFTNLHQIHCCGNAHSKTKFQLFDLLLSISQRYSLEEIDILALLYPFINNLSSDEKIKRTFGGTHAIAWIIECEKTSLTPLNENRSPTMILYKRQREIAADFLGEIGDIRTKTFLTNAKQKYSKDAFFQSIVKRALEKLDHEVE